MTVGELLARIDSRELSEWLAFARLHPLPDPWRQTAQTTAALFSALAGRPWNPDEWVPLPDQVDDQVEGPSDLDRFDRATSRR